MPDVVLLYSATQVRDKAGKWSTLPGFSGGIADDTLLKKKMASLASLKSNAKKAGDHEKLAKIEHQIKQVKEAHAAAKSSVYTFEAEQVYSLGSGNSVKIKSVSNNQVHIAMVDENGVEFIEHTFTPDKLSAQLQSLNAKHLTGAGPQKIVAEAPKAYNIGDKIHGFDSYEITSMTHDGVYMKTTFADGSSGGSNFYKTDDLSNKIATGQFKHEPGTPTPSVKAFETHAKPGSSIDIGFEAISHVVGPGDTLHVAKANGDIAAYKVTGVGPDHISAMHDNGSLISYNAKQLKEGLVDGKIQYEDQNAGKPAKPIHAAVSPHPGLEVGHKVIVDGKVAEVTGFHSNGNIFVSHKGSAGSFPPDQVFVPHLPKDKQPGAKPVAEDPIAHPAPAGKVIGVTIGTHGNVNFTEAEYANYAKNQGKTTTVMTDELKASGVQYAAYLSKDAKSAVLAKGIDHPDSQALIEKNKAEYLAKYSKGTKPTQPVPGPQAPTPPAGASTLSQPTPKAQYEASTKDVGYGVPADALKPVFPATHGKTQSFVYYKDFHGTHERYLFKDQNSEVWMVKPQTQKAPALAEVAAHKIGWIAGHDLSDIRMIEVTLPNGQKATGAMQKFHDVHGHFDELGITPSKLNLEQKGQVMRAQTLDWLLANHDTHGENLLVGKDGNVKQIDKGQSWRYFGKDKLSETYNPNPVTPFYNKMWSEYVAGKIDVNFHDALPSIKAIKAIPDEELTKHMLPVFQARDKVAFNGKGGWHETAYKNSAEAMQALLDRKNNIDKDFETFYKSLATKRAMKTGSAYAWDGWGSQ